MEMGSTVSSVGCHSTTAAVPPPYKLSALYLRLDFQGCYSAVPAVFGTGAEDEPGGSSATPRPRFHLFISASPCLLTSPIHAEALARRSADAASHSNIVPTKLKQDFDWGEGITLFIKKVLYFSS